MDRVGSLLHLPEVKHNSFWLFSHLRSSMQFAVGTAMRQWICLHDSARDAAPQRTSACRFSAAGRYHPVHVAIDRFTGRALFFRDC